MLLQKIFITKNYKLQIHPKKKYVKTCYGKISILKGNIITYNKHKHKNTRISVLIHPENVAKQYQ